MTARRGRTPHRRRRVPPARRPRKGAVLHPSFQGTGGELFGLSARNLALTILSFGVYYFWGRARVRRYLWATTELAGDRFAFHGTGLETFKGWLKVALVLGVPYLVLEHGPQLAGAGRAAVLVGRLLAGLLALGFVPFAVVGARRYRLSRTSWRAVRFSFRGSWPDLLVLYVKGAVLSLLTFGLFSPFFAMDRHAFNVNNTWFGDRRFAFDGRGEHLFGAWFGSLLLAVPTLGLSLVWYSARRQRYTWEHTYAGRVRFAYDVRFGDLLVLQVVNALLLIGTVGLAFPWVLTRTTRFVCDRLALADAGELRFVRQDARPATATGEEAADFLSLDFDFG